MVKRKLVDPTVLIDWWLTKYHNTNLKEVQDTHPEWLEEPEKHTNDFYREYMVTQEQHDEWEKWAKEYTKKITKVNKAVLERSWVWTYLNTAPRVKEND